MKHLRLYENFDEETPWEQLVDEYVELSGKMDKFMPDDEGLMDEYYELLNAGDENGLIEFFENNADEEKMMRYMPDGGGLNGFVKYLINNEN